MKERNTHYFIAKYNRGNKQKLQTFYAKMNNAVQKLQFQINFLTSLLI